MAVIKLGTIITDIAGSVGGTTFRRIKGGHSIFNKQNRILRNSLLLNSALLNNAQLIRRWSTLSSFEKAEWNITATTFQFPDRFGNLRYLTGRQFYVKINSQLAIVSNYLEFAGAVFSDVATPTVSSIASSVGDQSMSITYNDEKKNIWQCFAFKQVRSLGTPQPYRRYAVQGFNFASAVTTEDVGDIFFGAFPNAQAGQFFELHVYFLNDTGYMSTVTAVQFILGA